MEPFVSLFSTHDRALVYVGVSGEERGRLILYDITDPKQPKKTILTAKDLLVRQFQIYPGGDKILFSAQDPSQPDGTLQLFTVTTGIRLYLASPEVRPGKLERVLDNQDYANLAFKLSANGQTLIVLRSNRQNPADSGLWMVPITTSTVSTSPPSTDCVSAVTRWSTSEPTTPRLRSTTPTLGPPWAVRLLTARPISG
jgi:hypothetical protein